MDEQGLHARYRAERQERYERTHPYSGLEEPLPLPDECEADDPLSQAAALNLGSSPSPNPSYPSSPPHLSASTTTKRTFQPHLQFMCGPMLRYDTVDLVTNTWLGFCCAVTADRGSVYNPAPILELQWNLSSSCSLDPSNKVSQLVQEVIIGHLIHVYHGPHDSHSFWRFRIAIPMAQRETQIRYSINRGAQIAFCIPAIGQNLRWAAHSCNGFSAGVDPNAFNGPDPVWNDLLEKHKTLPYHVLVGGGDQLYCDPIAKEPELSSWLTEQDQEIKKQSQLTEPMKVALDRFFFSHYCKCFRSGAFRKAISCIPMLNMLDDHDLIDGFGSYPADLQLSPVFSAIGNRGYFWFLLFQLFIVDSTDNIHEHSSPISSIHSSLVLGGMGPYIRSRNHSLLSYMGPQVWILLLDCRSERKKDQVCSAETYRTIFEACKTRLPSDVTHLVIQLGIPIIYPRMVFAERFLERHDRLLFKALFKVIPGFHNNFNAEPELLDDMNDHWCAQSHKKERNWFIVECQKIALQQKLRITFLSGDVHCAAVGRLFTTGGRLKPDEDAKYMLNVVSSAIVNTPPPAALIGLMGHLSKVRHKTLSKFQTDEDMVDVFKFDTDGNVMKNKRFMARRNYCAVRFVEATGEMEFNIRIEVEQGAGKTKGYPVLVPPPNFV